jgi:hypothetical protein
MELPANVVVVVTQVPDRGGERGGLTTPKEFHHRLAQVAVQKGRRVAPEPGGDGYDRLKHVALGELLDNSWIRGQAAEMGIGLRPPAVARELAVLKKKAFKSGAQYRHYLRHAHFTRRDVDERVEILMFSERIQERVVAGFASLKGRQRALDRFIAEYAERWRARTVCAVGYITVRCSNGPAPKSLERLAVF